MKIVFTVGHSNRAVEELQDLLQASAIEVLVDVRRFPSSRFNPQFNRRALESSLRLGAVRYEWWGEDLGGHRESRLHGPHGALNALMRGYAHHMTTTQFRTAIASLVCQYHGRPLALMCAEKNPAHCHRSLISDFLVMVHGIEVRHLIEAGTDMRHQPHPHARRRDDGLSYDGDTQIELAL